MLKIALPVLMVSVPGLHAGSLEEEYESLKQHHHDAVAAAIAPIDREFTAGADVIAARALRQNDPVFDQIKRERVPAAFSEQGEPSPFENTYWKFKGWGNLSMVRVEAGGVFEEFLFKQDSGHTRSEVFKWEPVNETLAWSNRFNLTLEDGKLVRSTDHLAWEASDRTTFYKFKTAQDVAAATAAFDAEATPAEPASQGAKDAPSPPGKEPPSGN